MEDKNQFDILFRRYYNQLFLFARQFLHVEEDCHDAVSEVYEEVWIHYVDIEDGKALQFMYQCLRRNCLDRLRHKKVEQKYIKLSSVLSESFTTIEQIEEMKRREQIIENVINSLPDPTKAIFFNCYVERKKYQETADLLGISTSTVKKHIIRALKLISEQRTNS